MFHETNNVPLSPTEGKFFDNVIQKSCFREVKYFCARFTRYLRKGF